MIRKSIRWVAVQSVVGVLVANLGFAAGWSKSSISYRAGDEFHEPANPAEIHKDIYCFTHVSGYQYGQNFVNLDVLQSDSSDAARGGAQGAHEIYVAYSHQLYLGRVLNRDLSFGPVKDVALSTRFDWNSKNTEFAPKVRKIIVGPTLKINVPRGFFDIGFYYYDEKNNNGITGQAVVYDSTYRFALAWGLPFEIGNVPLSFEGFLNHVGEKGKDGFGSDTDPETWTDVFLMVDVGQLAFGEPNSLRAGVGFEYINSKFGSLDGSMGSETTTPLLKVQWQF